MFKPYTSKDVHGCVKIRGRWYWLEINEGEARELLGKYLVCCMGWGSQYTDWDTFTDDEKKLLQATLEETPRGI